MQSKCSPHKTVSTASKRGLWSVDGSPVKHILAPTALTAYSKESVAYAVRLARVFDAKLTLLHVWPGSDRADIPFSPRYTDQLELDGRRALEESHKAERTLRVLRDRVRMHHALTEDCFLLGDPGPLILWVARECHADLIVISTPHYHWLDGLFAGISSDKILREAPCSVLVVPSVLQDSADVARDNSLINAGWVKASLAWAKRRQSGVGIWRSAVSRVPLARQRDRGNDLAAKGD